MEKVPLSLNRGGDATGLAQGSNTIGGSQMGRSNIIIGNISAKENVNFDGMGLAEEIGAALYPPDPADDREKLINEKGGRVPGTCEWIRSNKTYLAWLDSRSQLLWLTGGPGKGKTMLSIFLTEELTEVVKKPQGGLLTYYFCVNGDGKRNTAVAILRGLLFQILQKRGGMVRHFLQEYEVKRESLFSSLEPLWRIFEAVVRDPELGIVYCILDGLDECDEVSLGVLITKFRIFFSEIGSGPTTGRIKLIAASRELPQRIAGQLSGFPRVKLDGDSDNEVNKDIRRFINFKVDELSKVISDFGRLRQRVEDALRKGAEGTFLWVGFVADELRGKRSAEVVDTLNGLPSGLPGMYSRMLLQIKDSRRDIAALILRWVVLAIRPLSLAELAVVTKADSSHVVRDYIDFCGPLLKVAEEEVSLVHQSAKDYFLRKEPDADQILESFRVRGGEANLEIARTCFKYIHNGAYSGGWVELENTWKLQSFPLLNYAAFYWPEHARNSPDSTENIFDPSSDFCNRDSPLRHAWWQSYFRVGLGSVVPYKPPLLHLCSYLGVLPLVRSLLAESNWKTKLGPWNPANEKDSVGWTPLFYAAKGGHVRVVELLVRHRANVNMQGGQEHETALHVASFMGHVHVVGLLLEKGAFINARGYGTALQAASYEGYYDVVKLLLEKGADVNAPGESHTGTALQEASSRGHSRTIELLLKNGAHINAGGEYVYGTALQVASHEGHYPTVKLLLEKGAAVDMSGGRYRSTALQDASHNGRDHIVELLLEQGANVNAQGGRFLGTALQAASLAGHCRIVVLLLRAGADADARGDFRYGTALHAATYNGHPQVIELLLKKEVNINALGEEDPATALQVASSSGRHDVVEMLLEQGADINARGKYYYGTPLQAASYHNHEKIVELLLEKGANANAPGGKYIGTALQVASSCGHERVVELLLHKGADVNARGKGKYRKTALGLASRQGHKRVAELLQSAMDKRPQ